MSTDLLLPPVGRCVARQVLFGSEAGGPHRVEELLIRAADVHDGNPVGSA